MKTAAARPTAPTFPSYTRTLPRDPSSTRVARMLVAQALNAWGLEDLTEAASVCVSELMANAVQHSRSRLVRVTTSRLSDDSVRIAVTDKDRNLPIARHARQYDEHGRGLTVVAALADRWGTDPLRWGKSVWCEFSRGGDK